MHEKSTIIGLTTGGINEEGYKEDDGGYENEAKNDWRAMESTTYDLVRLSHCRFRRTYETLLSVSRTQIIQKFNYIGSK